MPVSLRRFVNASVEFDTATLQPKYRLLWGPSGSSYALSVARTIGLDPKVLTAAEAALEEMAPATALKRSSELRVRESLCLAAVLELATRCSVWCEERLCGLRAFSENERSHRGDWRSF